MHNIMYWGTPQKMLWGETGKNNLAFFFILFLGGWGVIEFIVWYN